MLVGLVVLLIAGATAWAESSTEERPGKFCSARLSDEQKLFTPAGPALTRRPVSAVAASLRLGGHPRAHASAAARKRAARRQKRHKVAAARLRRALRKAKPPVSVDSRAEPLASPAQLNFPFEDGRETLVRHQVFKAPTGVPVGLMQVSAPFGDVSDADGNVVPYTQLAGRITRRGPGALFTVAVCINPAGPTELQPGTYSGAVLVGARNLLSPVTVQATVQDDRWWRVALAALIGGLAGLFVKLYGDMRALGGRRRQHILSAKFAFALGAAGVTAVYSYLTIYVDDPTFVASGDNLWRVTAEVFAGTLAAKALTDLGSAMGGGATAGGATAGGATGGGRGGASKAGGGKAGAATAGTGGSGAATAGTGGSGASTAGTQDKPAAAATSTAAKSTTAKPRAPRKPPPKTAPD